MKKSELDLIESIYRKLKNTGIPVAIEIPFWDISADLAFRKNGNIIIVEAKKTGKTWRTAYYQIRRYLNVSDYLFIATPARKITDEIKKLLGKDGIGYYFIEENGSLIEKIVAKRQNFFVDILRENFLEIFDCLSKRDQSNIFKYAKLKRR